MPKPTLKNYEIIETVGNGAGSIVFKAHDLRHDRQVAIKHVTRRTIERIESARRASRSADTRIRDHPRINYESFFDQVRNEYRILRTLDQSSYPPGVVRMYALHTLRRFLRVHGYDLVMEFIDGTSLRDHRAYPMPDLLRFYREAASALGSLHAHKILHADMKPHHIFIGKNGRVKLLDFGQSRLYTGPAHRIQGTVDFMAPEQAKGTSVDPRTDVYGLGATMYWVLTGELNRPSLSGMGHGVGFTVGYAGRAREVRDKTPDCPPALEELILESCERRPEKRPSSMGEVISRLDTMLAKQGAS